MANRYANLVGSNKIKDEWQKINEGFDKVEQDVDQLRVDLDQEIADREAAVEYVDQRVDNIIVGGGPDKDPELVDIRTVDPSYTPQRTINTAGDVTRDMQAQFMSHKADTTNWQRYKLTGDDGFGKGGFFDGDLDDLVNTGQYSILSSATNVPVASNAIVYVMRRSNDDLSQLWVTVASARTFIRTRYGGSQVWTPWMEVVKNPFDIVLTLRRNFPAIVMEDTTTDPATSYAITALGEKISVRIGGNSSVNERLGIITNGLILGGGPGIYHGTGVPEGSVTASPGSIYLNRNGGANTTIYVKRSGTGNTGWNAIA